MNNAIRVYRGSPLHLSTTIVGDVGTVVSSSSPFTVHIVRKNGTSQSMPVAPHDGRFMSAFDMPSSAKLYINDIEVVVNAEIVVINGLQQEVVKR